MEARMISQKTARKLRQLMRSWDLDPRQAEGRVGLVKLTRALYKRPLRPGPEPRTLVPAPHSAQFRLLPHCGRKKYQEYKSRVAAGAMSV
jgi:hypothetical protein